jgi:signal transduction histidine kinase
MASSWSIQRRLTVAYATTLFFALVAFAIIASVLLQHAERAQIDADLLRIGRSVNTLAAWHDGSFHPNEINDKQIARINSTLAESGIFDRSGDIVYSSSPAIPPVVRELSKHPIAQEWAGPLGAAKDRWVAAVSPIVQNGLVRGQVVVWHSEAAWESLQGQIVTSLALSAPIVALVALVLGGIIARQGLRPLYAMAGVVSQVGADELSRRVPMQGMPRELQWLATAFNRMLDRLESAFSRERQFTADASHELRAPLTVIRATADYALQNYRDGNEYRRALQTIGFEAQDLETLIRDLLAAARAESSLGATNGLADLAAVTFDVVEELYPIARDRGICVSNALPEELRIALDPQSTARLVRVLLDNAMRHAVQNVWVRVVEEGAFAILTVTDDGSGFSADALVHATERFWRDDASHRRGDGTGLGLSIAQSIAQAAGGTIELRNSENAGAQVRITLLLADYGASVR